MKSGAGMVQDKRVDMGSMGDFNGVVGKNPGSRHQTHKESAMDRSPYYDKVWRTNVLNTKGIIDGVTSLSLEESSKRLEQHLEQIAPMFEWQLPSGTSSAALIVFLFSANRFVLSNLPLRTLKSVLSTAIQWFIMHTACNLGPVSIFFCEAFSLFF